MDTTAHPEPLGAPRRGRAAALFLLLIVVPVILYAPLLDNGAPEELIMYAWASQVHQPADILRPFTIDLTREWITSHYDYGQAEWGAHYRPVTHLYFMLLRPFFGFWAPGYRAMNLLIYTLGTLLVLRFILRLTGDPTLAWLTAGLFAVNTVRTEYFHLMGLQGGGVLVLYVASALCYLRARTSLADGVGQTPPRPAQGWNRWYLLSLLTAAGAYFDYELAISLPLALFLIEWFGGRQRRQWAFRPLGVLPHALIALGYVAARTVVEGGLYGGKDDTAMLRLSNPLDLLYVGIYTTSRVIMLFVPNFPLLRQHVKLWLFGDVPGRVLLAGRPLLLGTAAGLLLLAVGLLLWGLSRPRIRQALWQAPRGQWVLWAGGWILVTIGPMVTYDTLATRHLLLAAVGADLLKALAVSGAAAWLVRRGAGDRRRLTAGLLALLLLYNIYTIVSEVRAMEHHDRQSQHAVSEVIRLVRDGAQGDRPIVVYALNAVWWHAPGLGLQELVRAALGRDNIRVVVPYALPMHEFVDEPSHATPRVTITPEAIEVVNLPQRPYTLGPMAYKFSGGRPGLTIRNGALYTLEVQEVDPVSHSLLRFTIRYARPPGAQVLFLVFDQGRLVRREAG